MLVKLVQLEFKFTYYDDTIQHISHYAIGTPFGNVCMHVVDAYAYKKLLSDFYYMASLNYNIEEL